MRSGSIVMDRVLGYGGFVLSVLALVSLFNSFDIDAETVTSVVGLTMVAWITVITIHHIRTHPKGPGRGLLIAGWALLGVLLVFAILQAIDTAAFDDGIGEGLLSLATAPPRVMLILPLLLASIAISRDGDAAARQGHNSAKPN